MSGILVVCEQENGEVKRASLELVTKAKKISADIGGTVHALVMFPVDGDGGLGAYGVETMYAITGDDINPNNSRVATRIIANAIETSGSKLVLGTASPQGKSIFPRLSAKLSAGLAAEVTDLSIVDSNVVGKRPQYAGKVFSDVSISSDVKLFTVRPNSFTPEKLGSSAANIVPLSVTVESSDTACRLISVEASSADVVDLTEADRIVAGGRSVRSKESFDTLIRPLAASIGATPGASRAAVDAGYAAHSEQVGQTGKVVNPSLYFACGISGAIQHLAGMRTSRVIVAINKDPDAPIFKHATYGIVADMFDVCPELTKLLSGNAPVKPAVSKPAAAPTPATPAVTKSAPVAAQSSPAPAKDAVEKSPVAKQAPVATPTPVSQVSNTAPSESTHAAASATVSAAQLAQITNLQSDVASLKSDLAALKDAVQQLIATSEKGIKQELQRVEKNARTFQEGGIKRYESMDKLIVGEVRKVRETLRAGIKNDTTDINAGVRSMRTMVASILVLNVVLIGLMIWSLSCS